MPLDRTQQQSLDGLQESQQLSLQATVPPAEIPGYELDRLLGQGAFGQVWLAKDQNTSRPVAIKFYLHRGTSNLPVLSREVGHLVNMSSGRHIVQVLTVGWEAEPPYYVMEYLENGSLEELIRARGPLAINEAVSMLREIAEGLSYAHSKGVLHCDLKPANVMLDHAWRPRLADFGQGRMTDDQTPSLGTLFFMAPEQADLNASPDAAWDVYALGAIGYTLITGSPPYRTPEVIETLDTAGSLIDRLKRYRDTITRSARPRQHYRRRGIDKTLCTIVDRCLDPKPSRRFGNVQQVLAAIDNRQSARARRPLYMLGIIGPIILMLLMMIFSARSISFATQESLQSVATRSLESNHFAARYAALTLESRIQTLFQRLESESRNPELRRVLNAVKEDEQSARLLSILASNSPHPEEKAAFLRSDVRLQSEKYLERRFDSMINREAQSTSAIFNTLFLTDEKGTHVGIAFSSTEQETASSPVGKNFAWRSYFTGNREDGSKSLDPMAYSPTRTTRLSSTFRSTSTGAWKMGVSTPVWPEAALGENGELIDAKAEPLGVLVLTINLGDFELLVDSDEAGDAPPKSNGNSTANNELTSSGAADRKEVESFPRFATLVDGRPGAGRGTILQHPLISKMDRETMRTVMMPRIDERMLDRLQNSRGVLDYVDPAAEFDNGGPFSGSWIATIDQVKLPTVSSNPNSDVRKTSDLWILVQERSSSVAAPIKILGTKLQRESYIELASLLLVSLALWFVVFRVGQQSLKLKPAQNQTPTLDAGLESTVDAER